MTILSFSALKEVTDLSQKRATVIVK